MISGFLATAAQGVTRAVLDGGSGWTVDHALENTSVLCLARDPTGAILAGTREEGILRSTDNGQTWQPGGLAGRTVTALAASRVESGLIYAGTRPPHLFASHDGGSHWDECPAFRRIPFRWLWRSPASAPFTAYVQAIALSPVDPRVLVVGIEAGAAVRGEDGGAPWSRHRRGALRDCHSLTFHVTDGDWVYEAGGTGAGVSYSRDAGRTWTQLRIGLDRHYGWACAADPERPHVWYASASPGPMKAHSAGNAQAVIVRATPEGWLHLGGGLPQPLDHMPYGLITDPDAPGHLYAGLSNGDVWHSADHGDHWEKLPFTLGAVHRTIIPV